MGGESSVATMAEGLLPIIKEDLSPKIRRFIANNLRRWIGGKKKAGVLTHLGFPLGIDVVPAKRGIRRERGEIILGELMYSLDYGACKIPVAVANVFVGLQWPSMFAVPVEALGFFCNNLEGDFAGNLFVEVELGGVFAQLFYCALDFDYLAVDVVAGSLESVGNLSSGNRTVNRAVGGSLSGDSEGNIGQRCCESFCVGFELSNLVGLLTFVFFELTEVGGVGDNGLHLGDEVVAAITVFNFYDVVLVAKAAHVFFQYDLHIRGVLIGGSKCVKV